jgi:hypothetical protein
MGAWVGGWVVVVVVVVGSGVRHGGRWCRGGRICPTHVAEGFHGRCTECLTDAVVRVTPLCVGVVSGRSNRNAEARAGLTIEIKLWMRAINTALVARARLCSPS